MVAGSTPRRSTRSVPFSESSIQETPKSHLPPGRLRPRDPVTGRFISFAEAERRQRDKKDKIPEDSPRGELDCSPASDSPDPMSAHSPPEDKDVKSVERSMRAGSTPRTRRPRSNSRSRRGC